MPSVLHIKEANVEILVWKIEEDFSFFASQVQLSVLETQEFNAIHVESRKLEWMATRFVQRQLIRDTLLKDEFDKPNLENAEGHVSLAHCKNYAVAAFSANPIGVDIEPIHEKVKRVKHKFLSVNELQFIDAENETEHLITCWSLKESLYKKYGRKRLDFIGNMQIEPFEISTELVNMHFIKNNKSTKLCATVKKIENTILTWC